MRNSIAVLLLLVAIAAVDRVCAQDQPEKFELYGGYGYSALQYKLPGQRPAPVANVQWKRRW